MTFKLKNTARTNIFNVAIFKLNIITNGGSKAVKKRHDKNYQNLEKKLIVHLQMTFLILLKELYKNSQEKQIAVSFGLEQHILINTYKSLIYTDLSISIRTWLITFKIYQKLIFAK